MDVSNNLLIDFFKCNVRAELQVQYASSIVVYLAGSVANDIFNLYFAVKEQVLNV